jgi:hypothetical protein
MEASPGIEPGYADLQSAASPLRHEAFVTQYLRGVEGVSSRGEVNLQLTCAGIMALSCTCPPILPRLAISL